MKTGSGSILVIDDEAGIRELLKQELTSRGYQVTTANDGRDAINRLTNQPFHVALCDIRLPEWDGMETLGRMQRQDPDLQVIMMTGYASIESAIHAMKKGAFDFIEKPFHIDQVATVVSRAMAHRDMRAMVSVYEMSRIVFDTVDLEHLLPALARNVQHILGADEVSVLLRRNGEDWTTAVPSEPADAPWEVDHRTLACLVQPGLASARTPFLVPPGVLENVPGISSALFCPLHLAGDWQGLLLAVRRAPHPAFLPLDVRHGTIFASFAVQAIRNARLYDQLIRRWKELDDAHRALQEAQQQLVQNEKMVAIGQLAAGVAHELNNPLTGIMGFAQMLVGDKTLTEQQHNDIQTIYEQSQRCRKIIQNLLRFSRRSESKVQNIDLASVLRSAEELARYELVNAHIRVENEVPEKLPLVRGDAAELQHILLNLFTNARQALVGRPNPMIHLSAAVSEDWVSVSIRDNGPGIAPEHLSKIFDPFFTTKPAGEGTGLGLSLCHNIAKNFGGRVKVDSHLGNGATFTLELPHRA